MQDLIPEFAALKSRYPAGFESSLVMPCLRRIQEKRGYVANEDIDGLAAYLGVPRIQIEEALSFYTEFRRAPVGRVHIAACRNVSCSLRGAERIVEHLARRLGIRPGETTKDGRFSFATVECLASCGTAPVVTANGTYHEDMTPERIDALLSELRQ